MIIAISLVSVHVTFYFPIFQEIIPLTDRLMTAQSIPFSVIVWL